MGSTREADQSCDHNGRKIGGVSLLEVLIGVLLTSIIAVTLYELLTSQQRTYSLQDEISEMQQNLRVGIEKISRDVTMAGFGKPAWSKINHNDLSSWYNAGASYFPIGAGTTLDIIACQGSPDGTVASMNLSVSPATITLNETATEVASRFNTTTRSDISIGGRENNKITNVAGKVLTISAAPAYTYTAGTGIFVVRHTTYSTGLSGGTPALLIDEHLGTGRQAICQFVTALSTRIDGNSLAVTLTGRTRDPDRTTGNYVISTVKTVVLLRNP
jgi:Tfp pilus assembly protein PilW